MSRTSCYFCRETDELEEHHIVPRRHNGSDESENLVDVCPTCHEKLETLYDKRFYVALGVTTRGGEDGEDVPPECSMGSCSAEPSVKLPGFHRDRWMCDGHECYKNDCTKKGVRVIEGHGKIGVACEEHSRCNSGSCRSQETEIVYNEFDMLLVKCPKHVDEESRDPPTTPTV